MNQYDILIKINDKIWKKTGSCLMRCIDEEWADDCPWRSMQLRAGYSDQCEDCISQWLDQKNSSFFKI